MKYFHGFPYQRVGIDIYPIDYISRDKEFAETQREIIKLGLMILRQWNELNRTGCLKQCVDEFGKLCKVDIALDSKTRNYIWKLIDKVCAMCYEEEADYAAYYDGWINNDNYRMHKECFKDVIKMPFENMMLNVSTGYDEILKVVYGGNYMIPVKGASNHDYPFYGHMEQELIKQIRNVGFKGTVDEFCEEVSSGRLRV